MKILHTGDWHMNDRLGSQDRSQDIITSLKRIAEYLITEDVDVMIVAGDVFCDKSDREAIRRAVGEIKRIFNGFLTRANRPGTIIAISGNHDNDVVFETLQNALELAPAPTTQDKTLAPGRMYFYHQTDLVRVADPQGYAVQFLLMPYPQEHWLRRLPAESVTNPNALRSDRFAQYLKYVEGKIDKTIPTVLVSHILVEGTATREGYKMAVQNDVVFKPGDIPTYFAYVAYGHIHQPQTAVTNASHIRYCGSVERLDAGESKDDKSVVVFEVGPSGLIGTPAILPLETTTPVHLYDYPDTKDPQEALAELRAEWKDHPDRERVLVKVSLSYTPGVHVSENFRKELHALFPRLYDCDLRRRRVAGQHWNGPEGTVDLSNYVKNATDYVTTRTKDDERKDDLLAALRLLLGSDPIPMTAGDAVQEQEVKN